MKLNRKCYLLLSGKENSTINVGNVFIKNSYNAKLLGVVFDEHVSFENHIQNRKLQALAVVTTYTDLSKKRFLNALLIFSSAHYTAQKMKFTIIDFFSKCDQIRIFLRIWPHFLKKSIMENFIFCAVLNSTINRLRERCLRLIYNNKPSTLEANEKDDFVSIHIKSLQTLAIEMYEVIRFSCNYDWGFRFREESI